MRQKLISKEDVFKGVLDYTDNPPESLVKILTND